jgi:hypothetical protein
LTLLEHKLVVFVSWRKERGSFNNILWSFSFYYRTYDAACTFFFCQTVHPLQPSASITSVRDSPYCKCHKKMTCRLPIPGQNNFYGIHSFLGQTGRGSMVSVVSGKNVPPPWNYFSGHGLCIMQLWSQEKSISTLEGPLLEIGFSKNDSLIMYF